LARFCWRWLYFWVQVLWIWVFSFFFLILDFGLLTCYFAGAFWWALVAAVAEFLFLGVISFFIFLLLEFFCCCF
jgi:hypothetical protein